MRHLTFIAVALATLTAAPVAAASAKTITLRLDAHSDSTLTYTPPVTSSTALKRGELYVATAQGTFSFYAALDYTDPQAPFTKVCGKPLAAPLFSSAGGTGKVGEDPEFVFAPLSKKSCTGRTKPSHWGNFEANDGTGWAHPLLAIPRPINRPTANHAYNYGLTGRGKPVSFRLLDTDVRDDYGAVQITIRPASHSACAGSGYKAFGLKSRAECVGLTVATKAPAAPSLRPLTLNQSPVLHVLRNSDVPTATNQEVASGALTAQQFAAFDTSSGSSARSIAKTLAGDGFVSAAVSEYQGGGLPNLTSTAELYRNPTDAQKAMAAELSVASAQAPAGTSVAEAPATPVGAESLTFTPATGTGTGGDQLILQVGSFVYDLRAVETPDSVSLADTEALLSTVTARFPAPVAPAELRSRLSYGI